MSFSTGIPKNKGISGSVEYLLLYYEIQDAGMITEGTVPVPPYRPCAERR
jgi:hypothetical protein